MRVLLELMRVLLELMRLQKCSLPSKTLPHTGIYSHVPVFLGAKPSIPTFPITPGNDKLSSLIKALTTSALQSVDRLLAP